MVGCTEVQYYDHTTYENFRDYISGVSSATTSCITEDENEFTVTATLHNAKPGDVMQVDLLKLQPHPNSESDQLLPIQGTRKETTVESSLRATVTYTKAEAEMTEVGEWVEYNDNGFTGTSKIS